MYYQELLFKIGDQVVISKQGDIMNNYVGLVIAHIDTIGELMVKVKFEFKKRR